MPASPAEAPGLPSRRRLPAPSLVQKAMERLIRGRILMFDHGRLVEDEPHGALMECLGSACRALFERQSVLVESA